MGDFFKSWRRRIGVVLLLCDCALATLWIASRSFDAHCFVFVTPTILLATMVSHEYHVIGLVGVGEPTEEPWSFNLERADPHETFEEAAGNDLPTIVWQTGYHWIGTINDHGDYFRIVAIVLSLRMLLLVMLAVTASLLIWPRRARGPKSRTSPISDPSRRVDSESPGASPAGLSDPLLCALAPLREIFS